MRNIKTRLLASFLAVTILLSIPTAVFSVVHYNIENQYKSTVDNMVAEYRITEASDGLVAAFGKLLQDADNKDLLAEFDSRGQELDSIFAQLNSTISYDKSRTIYDRLQNTVWLVKEYCQKSLKETKNGDFSHSSEFFEQISRGKGSIRSDSADLILAELSFLNERQQVLQSAFNFSWIFGLASFIAAILTCLVLAFILSNKISRPLVKLSRFAKDVSEGETKLEVQPELLNMKDEIGSLSVSFNLMIKKLGEKISQYAAANEELQKSKSEIEKQSFETSQKADELERLNKLMVDRELKMIDLKKEIKDLEEKLGSAVKN